MHAALLSKIGTTVKKLQYFRNGRFPDGVGYFKEDLLVPNCGALATEEKQAAWYNFTTRKHANLYFR
jgi:hypothetical protein